MINMEKGTPTGLEDMNCKPIRMGDIVEMFGTRYEVVYGWGAFGLQREDGDMLDWERIKEKVKYPDFCHNDHFVSLWELAWNFDCEDNVLDVVKRLSDSQTEQLEQCCADVIERMPNALDMLGKE
jgi:hypothetical protein